MSIRSIHPPFDQLDLLASVSQAFASSLNLEETMSNAVNLITQYMHAEAASLFLLEDGDQNLVCRVCAGPVDIVGYRLGAHQGIVGKAVRTNTVQFIRDADRDPDFACFVDQETGFRTRSILCAPLSVKGKRLGALEVLNKNSGDGLFDATDQHLLQVLASSASLVIHDARLATALVEQERIRKELELAREIQANLLPAAIQGPRPVAGINMPAREVSGDFYDFFQLANGHVIFSIGDVSGKGMNAALLMAKTSSLLHCLGKSVSEPAELLARVNDEVCESATRGMFVTVVTGIYEPATGTARFTNAGHLPPLYRDRSGRFNELSESSPPLGIMPRMTYDTVEMRMDGGCFYLVTDGVTEGEGPGGSPLGVNGLMALIDSFAELPLNDRLRRIASSINAGRPARTDDLTLLAIEDGI